MNRQVIARCVAVFSFLAVGFPVHLSMAQSVTPALAKTRPPELAGRYRVDSPSSDAASTIRFIKLFSDGRSRLEFVRIDATGPQVLARVTAGPFHRHPWTLKQRGAGTPTQLCFELEAAESCMAFHLEMPSGDLLLFAPEANWGSPSLRLRRQGPVSSFR
jgi:hypothetical protein